MKHFRYKKILREKAWERIKRDKEIRKKEIRSKVDYYFRKFLDECVTLSIHKKRVLNYLIVESKKSKEIIFEERLDKLEEWHVLSIIYGESDSYNKLVSRPKSILIYIFSVHKNLCSLAHLCK